MDIGMKIAIDVGTKYTRFADTVSNGIITERTLAAADENGIAAVGNEAEQLISDLPGKYLVCEPIKGGAVDNMEVLDIYMQRIIKRFRSTRYKMIPPKVYLGVRASMSDVEREDIRSSVRSAVSRDVEFVESPIAAVIGAGDDPSLSKARLVLCMGGGIAEAAVVCMNRIMCAEKVPLGGANIENEIELDIRRSLGVSLGRNMIEKLKIDSDISSKNSSDFVCARNTASGLPVGANIDSSVIGESIIRCLTKTADDIRRMIVSLPEEMYSDVMSQGMLIAGGGAKLKGIADFLAGSLGMDVTVCSNPDNAVILGMKQIMEKESVWSFESVISADEAAV